MAASRCFGLRVCWCCPPRGGARRAAADMVHAHLAVRHWLAGQYRGGHIEQTPDGFLWVATRAGLVRFDGVRFQPFPVMVPRAPAGEIKALVADRRGRLWVAKDHGVVICMDQGRATTVVGPKHAAADIGAPLMSSCLTIRPR